jgi:hypothetical protein
MGAHQARPFHIDELVRQGQRLPTIEQYAGLLHAMAVDDDHVACNPYGCFTDTSVDLLQPVQVSDRQFRFMPGPEFSPRLYRGETEYHEKCVPSLFRGLSSIEMFYWRGKAIELVSMVDQHPASTDLCASTIGALSYGLDMDSLAQHYGYKTALMDFSRSREVAMFFATCAYRDSLKSYVPLESGEAVLYTVDLKQLIESRRGSMLPLGLEPLPRPEAQKALAVEMMAIESLNDMAWAKSERVAITPSLSGRYFETFEGGRALFPRSAFDDLIEARRTNGVLALEALAFGLGAGMLPPHPGWIDGAREEFVTAGFRVESVSTRVDDAILNAAREEWVQRRGGYYGRIRLRGVADHKVIP